jgi:LysM repeat protein
MPYKIKKNEKISHIVDKFDMPYDVIKRFNPFVENENDVYEGKTLTFPRQYVVQPGQTYLSISEMYAIHPSYLKDLNPYVDVTSVIYPGQTIFLPAKEYV